MDARIVLNIKGQNVTFAPTPEIYNDYINAMQANNKVAPSHNFVMRCAVADDKDRVRELLALPGASVQIAGAIVEQYAPDLNIMVGEFSA
ncbi:putative phage tail assembly chaperone [Desulfovibrio psychrotolerans]|uniref:Phage protein n=1 Tax=Desulfovibrio psychrotolerans TaxID=415242 RepID=A0A7J0BX30_9BACT|nr:putative phage tail assembly chaperone [Desulfovibrio psychrotolerans]GFM37731.1 hypothetical protein DSM19430T_24150 [Desulfovibrio psychrotolerans]